MRQPSTCISNDVRINHPAGKSNGGSNRVNRGGSFNNSASNCRPANRNRNSSGNRNNNLGFRPALDQLQATEPDLLLPEAIQQIG